MQVEAKKIAIWGTDCVCTFQMDANASQSTHFNGANN